MALARGSTMAKTTRFKDDFMVSQKENSPPCDLEGFVPRLGAEHLPAVAHSIVGVQSNQTGIQLDQHGKNKGEFNLDQMVVGDSNKAIGHPQPLKSSNTLPSTQIQKGKDQAGLLQKFRQLRQWQQQQQDSMTRQQQEHMETLRMQQDKLQMLYAKAVETGITKELGSTGSPNSAEIEIESMPVNLNACQRFSASQLRPSSRLVLGSPAGQQPVLMSPQHFISSSAGLSNQMNSINNISIPAISPVLSSPQSPLSDFNDTLYPSSWKLQGGQLMVGNTSISTPSSSTEPSVPRPHLQMPHQVMAVLPGQMSSHMLGHPNIPGRGIIQESIEPHSDVESQSDVQSEVDTMSGIYPLHDADSRTGSDDGVDVRDQELSEEEMTDEENSSECHKTMIEALPPQQKEETENKTSPQTMENEDERPITPGIGLSSAKTFEELLEHQLKLEESTLEPKHKSPSPVKPRSFLRKGQGLARFRMKPEPSTKPNTHIKAQSTVVGQPKGSKREPTSKGAAAVKSGAESAGSRKLSSLRGSSTREIGKKGPASQTAQPVKVTRKVAGKYVAPLQSLAEAPPPPSFGSSTLASRVIGPHLGIHQISIPAINPARSSPQPHGTPVGIRVHSSIDESFQRMKRGWEADEKLEEDELEEFEMLEQAAANASFSSNCSVVVRVLEKARTTGPGGIPVGKTSTSNKEAPVRIPSILSPVDTGYASSDGRIPGDVISQANTASDRDEQLSRDGDEDSHDEDEESDGDVTLQEMSLDSALPGERVTSPVTQRKEVAAFSTEKVTSNAPLSSSTSPRTSSEDFDDEEAWGEIKMQADWTGDESEQDSDDSDDTIPDISTVIRASPPALCKTRDEHVTQAKYGSEDVTSTPPTSALVSKLFPQLKPKPTVCDPPSNHAAAPSIQPVTKATETVENGPSKVVQDKLQELEFEISKFRAENKALSKIRDEREQGLKRLQDEITAFEKQKSEELERLEKFREEETQKLRRERRIFEKYQKAARANPDKKEREEIESLRSQVTELQEEMKRRESRWSAASARYRNRVEALEEQNKELQEEVKLLEKYRLDRWRSDQAKAAKDSEDARPKTQRKTSRPVESESSSRPPLTDRPQPRLPVAMETKDLSPEQQIPSPLERVGVSVMDANNNPRPFAVSRPHMRENDIYPDAAPAPAFTSNLPNSIVQTHGQTTAEPSPDNVKPRRNVHFDCTETPQMGSVGETGDGRAGRVGLDGLVSRAGPTDGRNQHHDSATQEIAHPDGKVEQVQPDGSRVILFANGTRREISSDGRTIIVTFFNGDIKQIMPDQRVVYYYSEAKTTHTTYPDGLEVLQFPNNQIEKHYIDGTKEIIFPDQTVKYLYPNGTEECVFADGTVQRVNGDEGERVIEFPNGQREIHTKYFKKREYPNGTVKTVFQDGRTETRYSNGRLRVRDKEGRVVMDTADETR